MANQIYSIKMVDGYQKPCGFIETLFDVAKRNILGAAQIISERPRLILQLEDGSFAAYGVRRYGLRDLVELALCPAIKYIMNLDTGEILLDKDSIEPLYSEFSYEL